jgi:hypothetical protein
MGRVEVVIGWKVYVAPVSGWDGIFGIHPRDNRGLLATYI